MVETINSKKPRERKTGFSLHTPKKHNAPRGFLLGSLEAPRPRTMKDLRNINLPSMAIHITRSAINQAYVTKNK
jgi:hypothetical protein